MQALTIAMYAAGLKLFALHLSFGIVFFLENISGDLSDYVTGASALYFLQAFFLNLLSLIAIRWVYV